MKPKRILTVFLNDGQTYTNIEGCEIRIFKQKYADADLDQVEDYQVCDIKSLFEWAETAK